MRPLMQNGKVLVTNWYLFAPESEHVERGKSCAVVNKGPESPEAFARRVLGDLFDQAPLMVLNDEGHHAYRPAPLETKLEAGGGTNGAGGAGGSDDLGVRSGPDQPGVRDQVRRRSLGDAVLHRQERFGFTRGTSNWGCRSRTSTSG
jgi:hypothetical protein